MGQESDARTRAQLVLLERMAALDVPPRLMGGFAEDAVIGGTVSRLHDDVDWAVTRDELPMQLEQARALGFAEVTTWGESAPGVPFYLSATDARGISIDIGVFDRTDDHVVADVGRLLFSIDGASPPAGFRVHLPADAFIYPRASIDGVPAWPLSPLALYQVRIGIASRGAFGALTDKQVHSLARLRQAFFSDAPEDELMPRVEPLPADWPGD
jgi:hypothetical protein